MEVKAKVGIGRLKRAYKGVGRGLPENWGTLARAGRMLGQGAQLSD